MYCMLCEVDKAKLTIQAEEGQADSEDQFIIVVTNVYNVLHVTWGGQGKAYYPKQKKARLTPKTSSL